MLNKDFENFEIRLKTLREESREDFDVAEKVFGENYAHKLDEIFPRDVLGAKKAIAGRFIVEHVDNLYNPPGFDHNSVPLNKGEYETKGSRGIDEIFKSIIPKVIRTLPLNGERQDSLIKNILQVNQLGDSLHSYFQRKDDISRDPFFALVEDFSMDGDISKEEFLLLEQSYEREGDFLRALESLPERVRDMFHSHIEQALSHEHNSKKSEFESEYHGELKNLKERGFNIEPVIIFVSRSYYKTPGKLKKYESPKRRLRRTFKIALLKLLRAKLGNIDAQIMLERFEQGEDFEDFFMLLFKLLEVVNENPEGKEIFSLLNLDEDIQDEVFTAEENKQKILAGESLVMRIASLFSKSDANVDEQELGDGMLEKILDESTDIIGEDVYFNRDDENAGIYAESTTVPESEQKEEEINYDNMSPEVAYQLLKKQFHSAEEEKRLAFGEGRYDDIDIYNDSLLGIQSKLEKLSRLLGEEI